MSFRERWQRFGGLPAVAAHLVFFAAGLAALVMAYVVYDLGQGYATGGINAVGKITAKGITQPQSPRDRTKHWVRYVYQDVAGKAHEGSDDLHPDDWAAFKAGDPFPIQYLGDRPDVSRHHLHDTHHDSLNAIILLIVGVAIVALVSASAAKRLRRATPT